MDKTTSPVDLLIMMNAQEPPQTIVFFDGVCHLCNAFVDFSVERDPRKRLRFAALQGETAKRLLPEEDRRELDTVLVWSNGQLLRRSDAVLRVLRELGGPYAVLGTLGRVIPRFASDFVYNYVARHRYAWFGKAETCRLPTPEEKAQILP